MSDKTIELPLVLFAVTDWTIPKDPEDRVVQLILLNPSRCVIDPKIINYAFTKLKKQIWQVEPGLGIARLSLGSESEYVMIALGNERKLESLIGGDSEAEGTFSKFMGMIQPPTTEAIQAGSEPTSAYVNQ